MRGFVRVVLLATVLLASGCGIFRAWDAGYDRHDPGSIQRDDHLQQHPIDSLFGGGPT
jgi:hypothetical protein